MRSERRDWSTSDPGSYDDARSDDASVVRLCAAAPDPEANLVEYRDLRARPIYVSRLGAASPSRARTRR